MTLITILLAIILGILLFLTIFLRRKPKKERIELRSIKSKLEEADINLRAAHEQLDSLYKIFLEIENKQEEIMK